MSFKVLANTENMAYEDWLAYRRLGIGGSDASIVCGINRYKSPVELWLDKARALGITVLAEWEFEGMAG